MKLLTPTVQILLLSLAFSPAALAVEFDCMIQPAQTVEIRSPVVGLLQEVHVRRGSSIRRGDLLVSIESSVEKSAAQTARFRAQAQGGLLTAQNKLQAAREKARRFRELSEEEFVSAQARDDAEAELRTAEAELHTAKENSELAKLEYQQSNDALNRRVIRSPFDGVVVEQYLYPGALVDTGEGKKPILKIAKTDVLAAEAILPFKYFKRVNNGMAVSVVPEAPFSQTLPAKIKTVDRVIDSAAGTFGVVAELDNRKQEIPGGLRCKLGIPQIE